MKVFCIKMKLACFVVGLFYSLTVSAQQSCAYPGKREGSYDLFEDCGSVKNGQLSLNASHFNNLDFDQNGLACVIFPPDATFYIRDDNKSKSVIYFDNGCDYFVEGLARGYEKGKIVFINKDLDTVLKTNFEQAMPFDYGFSVVCNGPFIEEKHGEHTLYSGGQCGLINKQGDLVVEAKYKVENREVFRDYINSHNDCPPPPVTTTSSALCHAKRHVDNMEYRSSDWHEYQITRSGKYWVISYKEGSDQEASTLLLEIDTAGWSQLTRDSHNEVLQSLAD